MDVLVIASNRIEVFIAKLLRKKTQQTSAAEIASFWHWLILSWLMESDDCNCINIRDE
jgi:hypothetical protein